jgi:hypothetical protein
METARVSSDIRVHLGKVVEGKTGEHARERIDDDLEERTWVAFVRGHEIGVMPTLIDEEDVVV